MCKAKYGSLLNIKMQRTFLQIIFTLYRISHKGWDFRDDFILFHTFLFSTILIFFGYIAYWKLHNHIYSRNSRVMINMKIRDLDIFTIIKIDP